MRIRLVILSLALMLLGGMRLESQGAPDAINDAVAALNQQLGLNLTLNDVFWTWEQQTFPDSRMGCAQPDEVAQPTPVIGYRFEFIWLDVTYEYRVSADRTLTVFCGTRDDTETDIPENAVGTVDEAVDLSNSLCGVPPEGIIFPRTRLAPGIDARVLLQTINVRSEPNINAPSVDQFAVGAVFGVVAGPACDSDGYIWVQVALETGSAWVAEARGTEYFLEPNVERLDFGLVTLDFALMSRLGKVGALQGNYTTGLGWSDANRLFAAGNAGSEGLWVYDPADLSIAPRTLLAVERFGAVVAATNPSQRELLLLGGDRGTVQIWDISPGSRLIQRLVLTGHNNPVSAVAFSPNGRVIASTGGTALATVADDGNRYAILLWDIDAIIQIAALRGHTDEVTSMAFSPDGFTLASASADGSVRLWDSNNATQIARIDAGSTPTSLTFSPDGSTLAVGYSDGVVIGFALDNDISAGPILATHSAPIRSLSFSRDGRLLASGGADGTLAVHDASALLTGLSQPVVLREHTSAINGVAFSPDGTRIASIGDDHRIVLYGILP